MKTRRLLLLIAICVCFHACGGRNDGNKTGDKEQPKVQPLNITVLIDLSDRIKRNTENMEQEDKDIVLIVNIADSLKDKAQKEKFTGKDKFKVLFYPNPKLENINTVVGTLEINMEVPRKEKGLLKRRLQTIDSLFSNTLHSVYKQTKNDGDWSGSDIWGFFRDRVQDQCIIEGYRNILVILTDGYIYHKDNKEQKNGKQSWVTPLVLDQNPDTKLLNPLDEGQKLSDLEVLVLEVDPAKSSHFKLLERIWNEWFDEMGIKQSKIMRTDVPKNIINPVNKFLQ